MRFETTEFLAQKDCLVLNLQYSITSSTITAATYLGANFGVYSATSIGSGRYRLYFGRSADRVTPYKRLINCRVLEQRSSNPVSGNSNLGFNVYTDNCTSTTNPYIELQLLGLTVGGTDGSPTIAISPLTVSGSTTIYIQLVFATGKGVR